MSNPSPLTWSKKWSWDQKDKSGKPITWNGLAPEEDNTNMNTDINNAQLSNDDITAIKAAFATILAKVPFMQPLTVKDRRRTFKAGPKSLAFVQYGLQAAQGNPAMLPATFDAAAYAGHVALFSTLTDLAGQAKQLASELDNTRLAAGGIAMTDGRDVYQYAKDALKKMPGLQPVVDQLGERFQHATAEANNPTPTPTK